MKKICLIALTLSIIISLTACTDSPASYVDKNPLDNGQGNVLPTITTITTQTTEGLHIDLAIDNNTDYEYQLFPDGNFSYITVAIYPGSDDYYTNYFKTFTDFNLPIGTTNLELLIANTKLPKNLKSGTIKTTVQFKNLTNGGIRQKSTTEKFSF